MIPSIMTNNSLEDVMEKLGPVQKMYEVDLKDGNLMVNFISGIGSGKVLRMIMDWKFSLQASPIHYLMLLLITQI